jgi:predicted nucleotidyltransferase
MLAFNNSLIAETIVSSFPEVQAIYLFGSQATNSSRHDSDIDIAFLTSEGIIIPPVQLFNVKTELEVKFGKEVDLIHLNSASTVLQFQVTTTGIQLFAKNPAFLLRFEAMVLSQYQRFNEERKAIIEEIISSGKVYSN